MLHSPTRIAIESALYHQLVKTSSPTHLKKLGTTLKLIECYANWWTINSTKARRRECREDRQCGRMTAASICGRGWDLTKSDSRCIIKKHISTAFPRVHANFIQRFGEEHNTFRKHVHVHLHNATRRQRTQSVGSRCCSFVSYDLTWPSHRFYLGLCVKIYTCQRFCKREKEVARST